MSLETALEALAKSVEALANAAQALAAVAGRGDAIRAPTAAAPAPVPPKSPPAPQAQDGAAPQAEKPQTRAIRYDEVRVAITGYADRHGDPEARKLLAQYAGADGTPCKSAREVKPDDYERLIAACA